jgi:MFS family permease
MRSGKNEEYIIKNAKMEEQDQVAFESVRNSLFPSDDSERSCASDGSNLSPNLIASDEREADESDKREADESEEREADESMEREARDIKNSFILLSVLFSANHGAVVSCLALAAARLGRLGNVQSGVLYLSYTLSALIGATYIVKVLGARSSMIAGMWIYCVYVGCFVLAAAIPKGKEIAAILGALIGGVGGGFLWTAQGSYFVRASEEYSRAKGVSFQDATSLFGGIFAGIFLGEEVLLHLFSTFVIQWWNWPWLTIYIGYTVIAVVSTLGMSFVKGYSLTQQEAEENSSTSSFYKATVTFRLMMSDPKMKYMIPLIAVFAFSASFVASFVSGEVVALALEDVESYYIGILTSVTAGVAAVASVLFGRIAPIYGSTVILIIGTLSFFMISFLFVVNPNVHEGWDLGSLIFIYTLQGIGRATFEGSLKAQFAVIFSQEKEGAVSNYSKTISFLKP